MKNCFQLNIMDDQTVLIFNSDKITLPIGTGNINGFTFQHSPITPYEAELAIENIEDIIIPIRNKLPIGELTALCTDTRLQYLSNIIEPTGSFLTTEQIEILFNELVNVINGSPINSTKLPSDKSFTAFLLIIREISHHWGLNGIHIKE